MSIERRRPEGLRWVTLNSLFFGVILAGVALGYGLNAVTHQQAETSRSVKSPSSGSRTRGPIHLRGTSAVVYGSIMLFFSIASVARYVISAKLFRISKVIHLVALTLLAIRVFVDASSGS